MDSLTIENLVRQSFDEFYLQRLMKLTGVTLSTGYHKSVPPLTGGTREDRLRVGGENTCVVPNPLIQLH